MPVGFDPVRDAAPATSAQRQMYLSPELGSRQVLASSSRAQDDYHAGTVHPHYVAHAESGYARRRSASPPIPSPRSRMEAGYYSSRPDHQRSPVHYDSEAETEGMRLRASGFDAVRDTRASPIHQHPHHAQVLYQPDPRRADSSSSVGASPEIRQQLLHQSHPAQQQSYLHHPMHPPPPVPQLARTSSNDSHHSQGTRSSLGPAQPPTEPHGTRRPSRSASIADMLNDGERGPLIRNASGGSGSGSAEQSSNPHRQIGSSRSPLPLRRPLQGSPGERHALLPPHDVRRGGSVSSSGSGAAAASASHRAEQSPRSPALVNLLNSTSADEGRHHNSSGNFAMPVSVRHDPSPSVLRSSHSASAGTEVIIPPSRFGASMSPTHNSILQTPGTANAASQVSPSMSPGEVRRHPPRLFHVDTSRSIVPHTGSPHHATLLANPRATAGSSVGPLAQVEQFAVPQLPRRSPESRRATLPAFAASPTPVGPPEYPTLHGGPQYLPMDSPAEAYPQGLPPTPGASHFPPGYIPTSGAMPRTPVTPGGIGPYGEYQPPPTPGGSSLESSGPAGYFYHSQPPGTLVHGYQMSPAAASPSHYGSLVQVPIPRRMSAQEGGPSTTVLHARESSHSARREGHMNGTRSVDASPQSREVMLPTAAQDEGEARSDERRLRERLHSEMSHGSVSGSHATDGEPPKAIAVSVAKRKRSSGSGNAIAASSSPVDALDAKPSGRAQKESPSAPSAKPKKARRASTRESTAGDIRGTAPVPQDDLAAAESREDPTHSMLDDAESKPSAHAPRRRQSKAGKAKSMSTGRLSPAPEEDKTTPDDHESRGSYDVRIETRDVVDSAQQAFPSALEQPATDAASSGNGTVTSAAASGEDRVGEEARTLSNRAQLLPDSPGPEGVAMSLSEAASSAVEAESTATRATSVTSPSLVKPSSCESSTSDQSATRFGRPDSNFHHPAQSSKVRSPDLAGSTPPAPVQMPSPIQPAIPSKAPRTRYQAKRVSLPGVVRVPLAKHELERFRFRSSNPLRAAWQEENRGRSDGWDEMFERYAAEADGDAEQSRVKGPASKDSRSGLRTSAASVHVLPRKPDLSSSASGASAVASHYNARPDAGLDARRDSPILPLRQFNNWVKSTIITKFGARNGRVLDLGAGKGGDLRKWHAKHVQEVVLVDIAAQSIEQAKARYDERKQTYHAEFFAFDAFGSAVSEHIPASILEPLFDNVSLQFCMHYAWDKVSKVNLMLENVAKYLKPGGIFIGTIPDADRLRRDLKALPNDELSFGNEYFRVSFDPTAPQKKETCPAFGHKYTFWLKDAIDECDEYVVDFEQFESLANQMGLRLIYRKTFEEVWLEVGEQRDSEAHRLLGAMRIPHPSTCSIPMQPALWEAASLYLAFAFEKAPTPAFG